MTSDQFLEWTEEVSNTDDESAEDGVLLDYPYGCSRCGSPCEAPDKCERCEDEAEWLDMFSWVAERLWL